MKRQLFLSKFACLLIILISVAACKRYDDHYPSPSTSLLKEWKRTASNLPERSYFFYYNKNKSVDSVRLVEDNKELMKIIVIYKNGLLDSTFEYVSGYLQGFITGFQYDNLRRVTQFKYVPWERGTMPYAQVFHYNYNGETVILSYNTMVSSFRFNKQEDVEYINYRGNYDFEATFTFDKKLNPLAAIKDWYIISAMEPYLLEYTLSKHNSVLKNYTDGYQGRYKNIYDKKNRLVRKELVDSRTHVTQTFQFFYY